jgi:predicted transcriptional regulator
MVVGAFRVKGYDEDRPSSLWERHCQHAGITRRAYEEYYRQANRAIGILVDQACRFGNGVSLAELGDGVRAPQSFCYLDWTGMPAEPRRALPELLSPVAAGLGDSARQ